MITWKTLITFHITWSDAVEMQPQGWWSPIWELSDEARPQMTPGWWDARRFLRRGSVMWDDWIGGRGSGGMSGLLGDDWLCQLPRLPCTETQSSSRVTIIDLDFSACYVSASPSIHRKHTLGVCVWGGDITNWRGWCLLYNKWNKNALQIGKMNVVYLHGNGQKCHLSIVMYIWGTLKMKLFFKG